MLLLVFKVEIYFCIVPSGNEVLINPVKKVASMKHISNAAVYILVDRLGFDSKEALGLLTADDLDDCGMLHG